MVSGMQLSSCCFAEITLNRFQELGVEETAFCSRCGKSAKKTIRWPRFEADSIELSIRRFADGDVKWDDLRGDINLLANEPLREAYRLLKERLWDKPAVWEMNFTTGRWEKTKPHQEPTKSKEN